MTKLTSFGIACLFLMTAVSCGGGPTIVDPPLTQWLGAVSLTPASVTMSVGNSQVFAIKGGDPYGYIITPPVPDYAFDVTPIVSADGSGVKNIKVTCTWSSAKALME